MSSSQTSSSSTNAPLPTSIHVSADNPVAAEMARRTASTVVPAGPPHVLAPPVQQPVHFPGLMDVTLPVAVRLGSGSISVGACLSLRPSGIIRLSQSVGQDLDIVVNGETIARGEVAIVDDSTSIRLTDISVPQTEEVDV